jgi:hypothetical protein
MLSPNLLALPIACGLQAIGVHAWVVAKVRADDFNGVFDCCGACNRLFTGHIEALNEATIFKQSEPIRGFVQNGSRPVFRCDV